MNTKLWPALIALCLLAGCVSEAIRRNDDRYLQPGALDAPIAERYDTYQYRFLDKYRVTHDWLGVGSCGYRALPTSVRFNRAISALYAVPDIYEENGKTWQRFRSPVKPYDFDRYVRSQKRMVPTEHASVLAEDGNTRVTKAVKFEEKEEGFGAMCFEAWVSTSHATTLMLYKRTIQEWDKVLGGTWQQGAYAGTYSKKSVESVGGNTWQIRRVEIQPRVGTRIAGAFELWLLPIGDSGYTIALELGANLDSLKTPQAHAQLQAIFKHLVESVKIEALTPQIEAELAQNAQKANAIQLEECQEIAAKEKLPPKHWCRPTLGLPYPQE